MQVKKKKKKNDNSKKNDMFLNCRSCNTIITNDYRSKFDKRYCADCLQKGYMGLDQYGMIRNKQIDFKKVYSDKYKNILVDEMQDTNRAQLEMIVGWLHRIITLLSQVIQTSVFQKEY